MIIRGIHHVGITTADLERSKRFYGELLGLRFRAEGEDGPTSTLDRLVGLTAVRIRHADGETEGGQQGLAVPPAEVPEHVGEEHGASLAFRSLGQFYGPDLGGG